MKISFLHKCIDFFSGFLNNPTPKVHYEMIQEGSSLIFKGCDTNQILSPWKECYPFRGVVICKELPGNIETRRSFNGRVHRMYMLFLATHLRQAIPRKLLM